METLARLNESKIKLVARVKQLKRVVGGGARAVSGDGRREHAAPRVSGAFHGGRRARASVRLRKVLNMLVEKTTP